MTNEERFAEAERLAAIKNADDVATAENRRSLFGGGAGEARSCRNCRFFYAEWKCSNQAASLRGNDLIMHELRLDDGLCGPDGIFFDARSARPKPIRFFAPLTIGALLSGSGLVWTHSALTGSLFGLSLLIFMLLLIDRFSQWIKQRD